MLVHESMRFDDLREGNTFLVKLHRSFDANLLRRFLLRKAIHRGCFPEGGEQQLSPRQSQEDATAQTAAPSADPILGQGTAG